MVLLDEIPRVMRVVILAFVSILSPLVPLIANAILRQVSGVAARGHLNAPFRAIAPCRSGPSRVGL
jgi:hypothetical protein